MKYNTWYDKKRNVQIIQTWHRKEYNKMSQQNMEYTKVPLFLASKWNILTHLGRKKMFKNIFELISSSKKV